MKNASEIAKQLAELYGIPFVETLEPTSHLVLAPDGMTEPLTGANFRDVFGIPSPSHKALGNDNSKYETLENVKKTISSGVFLPKCKYTTNFQGGTPAVDTELAQHKTSLALAA